MNKITKTIAVAGMIVVGLAGCSTINSITSLVTLLNSTAGQALLAALGTAGNLIPGIQAVITNIDNGITGGGTTALNNVCYTLPWADGAVDFFGASVGMTATQIAEIDTAVAAFKAGPCTTPPTDIASALTEGIALFVAIENDLSTGGVPVVVPASKTITPATWHPHH